ncbi:HMG box-containing protein 1-like [Haliotis rufescens]|uniref:HMG box-containing protein 1-like n=1 Tax=Haliotis rufescens TaxID=6454 RepID=UPI00201F8AAF|nr:HMG box-containing protein 1-like [Haliotis rufescens]
MASESDGGVELGKRPHVKTHRMQEFLTTQRQGDGGSHKVRYCTEPGCKKTFTSAPGLRYHIKSHNKDVKTFLCSRCKKTFKSNNGLKYHQKNTKCEESSECHTSETDDQDEPDGRCDTVQPQLLPDPHSRLDPEFDGMDNLRELAIIATGPQSPLLRKSAPMPWDKPTGPVVRTLDLECPEACICGRAIKPENTSKPVASPSVSLESDPKVTSSSPFPSSPKDTESSEALWSHPWPTAVWQCFMRGSIIKFLSSSVPPLFNDWHSAEELSDHQSLREVTQSAEQKKSHIFSGPVGFLLTKKETTDLGDTGKLDLYFMTHTVQGDADSIHLVAQCAQDHPFFVKDKGWSSCAPQKTVTEFGIPCQELAEQDLCLPPTHPDATFYGSYQLSALDSTAVMALSSMAQQKKNQERQSLSSPDSPSKEDTFKFDLPKAKRPMNAFMLFAKENRIQYTQKYPGKDNRAISVLLGDEWKKLTPEDKKKFKEKSEALAKEQKQLHPDCWKRKK